MERHRHNDNLFKKLLEDHPVFNLPKEDIDDMRRRLDEVEKPQRKRGFFFWWLPLLLIPFMLGTFYFSYQNNQLNNEVQTLQNQLVTAKKEKIEQRQITYQFDTIYTTIYKDKIIERTFYPDKVNDSNSNKALVLSHLNDGLRSSAFYKVGENLIHNNTITDPFYAGFSNTIATKFQEHLISKTIDSRNTNESDLKKPDRSNWEYNNIFPIADRSSFLEKNVNWLEGTTLEESDIVFKKKRRNPLHYLTPKGFQIGISGSPIGTATLSGFAASALRTYGLTTEIEYSNNFRLSIGLQRTYTKHETKDPVTMAIYPSFMPDDPTDVIREMYATIRHLQVPISFKYLFYKNKKITPFMTVGFVASRSAQQAFEYQFINSSLEEYDRSQSFTEGIFSIKNLRGSIGFEYDFSSKWAASAETYYLHDMELNVGEYFLLRNLGLNIGLKRKL